jgi:hypothetical protein
VLVRVKEAIREEIEMKHEIKEVKEPEKLLCPTAGTATSSPNRPTNPPYFRVVGGKEETLHQGFCFFGNVK